MPSLNAARLIRGVKNDLTPGPVLHVALVETVFRKLVRVPHDGGPNLVINLPGILGSNNNRPALENGDAPQRQAADDALDFPAAIISRDGPVDPPCHVRIPTQDLTLPRVQT